MNWKSGKYQRPLVPGQTHTNTWQVIVIKSHVVIDTWKYTKNGNGRTNVDNELVGKAVSELNKSEWSYVLTEEENAKALDLENEKMLAKLESVER